MTAAARIRPITIIAPQIHLIVADSLARLLRPEGTTMDRLSAGDLLWVREPFSLPREFDHISPSQAEMRGARPQFAADPVTPFAAGRPRFARELLRAWHRQHLRVTAVTRLRAADISQADIARQGYALVTAFAADWNRNFSLSRAGQTWSSNPLVVAIDFERIAAPLPAATPEASELGVKTA